VRSLIEDLHDREDPDAADQQRNAGDRGKDRIQGDARLVDFLADAQDLQGGVLDLEVRDAGEALHPPAGMSVL